MSDAAECLAGARGRTPRGARGGGLGVRRRVSPLRSAGPAGAHLCVGLPGPADALERGRSFGRARFIPRPEAAPGAGGAVGTAWTVLAPPRAPAHVGRRPPPPPPAGCVSPRAGVQAGTFLPRDTRAAVRVAGAPAAVGLTALSGRRAVLATEPRSGCCCERALPPAPRFGGRVTPRRAVPPAPAHVQVPQRWLVRHPPARALLPPSLASSRSRETRVSASSAASTIRSLLLTFHFSVEARGGEFRSCLCHSGGSLGPPKRVARSLRHRPLTGASPQPGRELRYSVLRVLRESRGRLSRRREHRRRPERSAGAVSAPGAAGYVPAPERRAGGRGRCRWRRRDRHHCSPTPRLPRAAGRRSPSAGREPFFATARNPRGKVFGLPYSKRFCGEKRKRAGVRLTWSNTTSSPAQTFSTSCESALLASRFACFLGKAVGKPFSFRCHRVKSCMVLQCLFQRER